MMDNGVKTSRMALESTTSGMGIDMKECLLRAKEMVMGPCFGEMDHKCMGNG